MLLNCIVIFFALLLPLPFVLGRDLPFFSGKGDYYEASRLMSDHFKTRIQKFVNTYPVLNNILIPDFYGRHRSTYDAYVDLVRMQFPQYYDELRGIADGSGIEFHKIFLLNIRVEALVILGRQSALNECTDIHASPDFRATGHNEDGDPLIRGNDFVVEFQIVDGDGAELEHFVSYMYVLGFYLMFLRYPGILAGNAWGWNCHGLVFSGDALSPIEILVPGIPRILLYRHAVRGTTIDDALQGIASITNRGYGVSINVASIYTERQVNMEFSPSYFSFVEIRSNYSHMNNYKQLQVPYLTSESSVHRQARIDEMDSPRNVDDIRAILGDTKDKAFPIYRNSTLTTVVFDLKAASALVFVSNPKDNGSNVLSPIVRRTFRWVMFVERIGRKER